jgi:(5-formylfuran-3-yl)methyl phosphate synthase
MQLLVSVASAAEVRAALDGGADIIDAKDPARGALGPVSSQTLDEIVAAVAGARLLTAALGDASSISDTEEAARRYAQAGAAIVKVGCAGIGDAARVRLLLAGAVRGAREGGGGVVAVAYADAAEDGLSPSTLVPLAAGAGAAGVLVDTCDKQGPGLRAVLAPQALAEVIDAAHRARLFVALAGRLDDTDLPFLRQAGADIAGVRGAACGGARTGRVLAARVRQLRALCDPPFATASSR